MPSTMDCPVLIIGAGPTGLSMAAVLSRFDIAYRIIEKSIHASAKSKALVVQARTLEIFQQLDLDQEAIAASAGISEFNFFLKGRQTANFELGNQKDESTPFPYAAILPQDRTEAILIADLEKRGLNIEWHTELLTIDESSGEIACKVRKPDGSIEIISTQYVVGADGAHSPTRHHVNANFSGGAYKQSFMLTDAYVQGDIPDSGLSILMEEDFFSIYFPFKEKGLFRIISLIPEAQEEGDFDYLKQFIETNTSLPVSISRPRWTSAYRVHHRCVDQFRHGNIFLAGDAAHIHSPAGGQGMNTGIQDAHNLAWKLAMSIKGYIDPSILDSYQAERWPVAQHLVHGTDRGFKFMTSDDAVLQWLRQNVFAKFIGTVFNFERMQRLMFHFISQTHINYEKSYPELALGENDNFRVGHRFPWMKAALSNGSNIYELLDARRYTLFLFDLTMDYDPENLTTEFRQASEIINTVHMQISEETDLFNHYAISRSMIVLVRPDMHIAFSGHDIEELRDYLRSIIAD